MARDVAGDRPQVHVAHTRCQSQANLSIRFLHSPPPPYRELIKNWRDQTVASLVRRGSRLLLLQGVLKPDSWPGQPRKLN